MISEPPHILLLEPYYGGSHQEFLTGLQSNLAARCTLLSLPARKWKMRMQLAAPWFAEQIIGLWRKGIRFDRILSSTFLDVAVLRTLLTNQGIQLPLAIYFHENQFSYPGQMDDPGILQFASINFTSALSADSLAFNSSYNLESFLRGIAQYLKKAVDMDMAHLLSSIRAKSLVLYPGMDFQEIDASLAPAPAEPQRSWKNQRPVIVWNHRWEHDKDPLTFFQGLFSLCDQYDFQVIILGQHFRRQPEIFSQAKEKLADRILHFGFAESRAAYSALLGLGDIIVSTAKHEFFGLAILEGVRAGCRPLVPDRLSYRELFPRQYRYGENAFSHQLAAVLATPAPLSSGQAQQLTEPYRWQTLARKYQQWLCSDLI